MGDLGPLQTVSVLIQAVPGPGATVITHTNTVTVSGQLENNRTSTLAVVAQESPDRRGAGHLSPVGLEQYYPD